ncbi:MFS transporter [Roseovarius faecimaris]|uniref:MFS transporter n=1 Tax=Roseovarius faecimaris TaxID=2494550 RepID=A0A6I6ITF7_9RHOB|nr:TCR/Tet family MFS transporter [Roseovarius faecimaris]QGY00390.1 MFS transporter [Roseovarius faecimaris]
MRARLPTIFILVTVMLDAMGIGLILPVMPDLIQEVRGAGLANAALWGGVLSTTFAVMQFGFGPVIGNLSDRFGRRPVLLISLAVMAADYVVMALAGTIWLLLIGRIVGGITAATHATAMAFMSDIQPRDKRGQGFGLISAAFGMGFVLGPAIGGWLGDVGTRAPFYAAAALAALNFAFGYFILPETLPPEKRRAFAWRRANPFGALMNLRHLPGQLRLIVVTFLYTLSFNVYPAVWAYFTQAQFQWDTRMVGISLTVYGLSLAVVQAGLIRLVLARLGERRTVILGFGFAIVSYVWLTVLTNGWVVLALIPVSAFAAMATPALQALMSRDTPDDAQGELQGVLSSVNALAMILSPMLMTGVFYAFTAKTAPIYLPGAPFAASLVLAVVALWLFLGRRRIRA